MKKIIAIILAFAAVACLAACTPKAEPITEPDADITQAVDIQHEQEAIDGISFSDFEKRVLASIEYPVRLTLSSAETYQLELPFDFDEVTYKSDNENIARVTEDGEIQPTGNGKVMIHTTVDGMNFHTVVTIDDADYTHASSEYYTAFNPSDTDKEQAIKELEIYASSQAGFEVNRNLISINNDDAVNSNVFSFEYNHHGGEVKYKLLTTIDYLQMNGYDNIAFTVEETDAEIIYYFFCVPSDTFYEPIEATGAMNVVGVS